MNGKLAAGALFLALAPGFASAQMSYSGVELNFIDVDVGDVDVEGDGFEIVGSYEFTDRWFGFGKYGDQDLDFGLDGQAFEAGAGFKHGLLSDVDFVGTVSYVDVEYDLAGFTADDNGLALGAGVRARVARAFEIETGLRFIDLDESGSDTGFMLGGRWYFRDRLAVSAGTDLNDNADTFRLGFRAEF